MGIVKGVFDKKEAYMSRKIVMGNSKWLARSLTRSLIGETRRGGTISQICSMCESCGIMEVKMEKVGGRRFWFHLKDWRLHCQL